MLHCINSLLISSCVLGCLAQVATANADVCDQGTCQSSLSVADDFVDLFHEGPSADHLSLLQRAAKIERKQQEKSDELESAKDDSARDSHGDAQAKFESHGNLKPHARSTSSTVKLESHVNEKSDAIAASKGPAAGESHVDEKPKLESHIKHDSDLLAASKGTLARGSSVDGKADSKSQGVPKSGKRFEKVIVLSTRGERTKVKHANRKHLQEPGIGGIVDDVGDDVEDDESSSETTTNESWLSRLGNASLGFFLGIFVVIPCSISLLWVNERRNAQLESVISLGQKQAVTVDPDGEGIDEYDGSLVHMDSADAMGLDPVEDKRFTQVKKDSGILRLRSIVEVFQWKEETHEKKEKDHLGGGEHTKKTYTYKKEWCIEVIDSGKFHQKSHKNTVHIKNLKPGMEEQTNKTVKYGKNHYMPTDLVQMLNDWADAGQLVSGSLTFDNQTFKPGSNSYYYCGSGTEHRPEVGDFRVKIEYVPDGPTTILALQTKDKKHKGARSFGPYRAVNQGCWCCGDSEDILKERRLDAAELTGDELYEQEKCWDCLCFGCLCYCCNMIKWLFTHWSAAVPQLYEAWSGKKSKLRCFYAVKSESLLFRWGFRILGWACMWYGLSWVFKPLEVVLDIIPFLGPYLGSAIGWITFILSGLTTVIISMLIVGCAYMVYNPAVGITFLSLAAAISIGIYFLFDYNPHKAATVAAMNGTMAHLQHLYRLG